MCVCGIVGAVSSRSSACSFSHDDVARARDQLAHRGPDGAGLWPPRTPDASGQSPHAILGHRRLSIVDRTARSAQPLVVRDASGVRGVLVYNGELYNTHELRRTLGEDLAPQGDTLPLAHLLARDGAAALAHLRGMFALAWLDLARGELLLARDPLGIKPLLYSELLPGQGVQAAHVLFASELPALLSLREKVCAIAPDRAVVSAYLSTIRTTLGARTLFEGVRTLLPGEARLYAIGSPHAQASSARSELLLRSAWEPWRAPARDTRAAASITPDAFAEAATAVGEAVRESIALHACAEVPVGAMLSGGLDSTIIASELRSLGMPVRTYCARVLDDSHPSDLATPTMQDADFARALSQQLGTTHHEASLDADAFLVRWSAMVHALGTPLSTPNETAIFEVLRVARDDGTIVALSGEGADELFGGYTLVLGAIARALAQQRANGHQLSADVHARLALESGAWIGASLKPQVLTAHAWQQLGEDHALYAWASDSFAELLAIDSAQRNARDKLADTSQVSDHDDLLLGTHLRWQRRVNLAGLLHRLDTSSMLVGVEGRTPFADVRVLHLAESLPMPMHTRVSQGMDAGKLLLRSAFAAQVPAAIAQRSKASFPLPFQRWMGPLAPLLLTSELLATLVRPAVLALVSQHPEQHWNLAWPMLNLALWERRWWPATSRQTLQPALASA